MQPEIRSALEQLLEHRSLDADQMQQAVGAIMDGRCSEIEVASLLTGLAVKGETDTELAGAAQAMRARASQIRSSRRGLIDTCGTGGDKLHTFNISTATALVVAACGVPVAKHGNRSVSSSSGSADVLEQLGVNISLSPEQAGTCLDEIGICFCYARLCHGAMKHVAPVRQQLGFRTIFNLLGPLTNPAAAEYQLLGANRNSSAEKIARAASQLSIQRALVVCGNDQLDEVSLWGQTAVWDVRGSTVSELSWTAADFGLDECSADDLRVSSSEESAQVIRDIFTGRSGPVRDIVMANAAAALYCRGEVSSPAEGVQRAAEAVEQGAVNDLLQRLAEWTQQVQ